MRKPPQIARKLRKSVAQARLADRLGIPRTRLLKGWYRLEGAASDPVVTVRTALGRKTTQRGGSDAEIVARMLLIELAKDGKI
jgi:hypothetical protein